jgi:hypothetical protein
VRELAAVEAPSRCHASSAGVRGRNARSRRATAARCTGYVASGARIISAAPPYWITSHGGSGQVTATDAEEPDEEQHLGDDEVQQVRAD